MIERRTVLKAGIGAGIGLSLTPELVMGQDGPKPGDLLVRVGDAMKQPLSPGEIKRGAKPVIAWAMDPMNETLRDGSKLNQVLLVRFDSSNLAQDTRSRAADGVVAYSAICTHADCVVDDFLADEQVLDASYFHLSDEPGGGEQVENYRRARKVLRSVRRPIRGH